MILPMPDIGLAVAIGFVTLLTAYLGVHVTLHPADSARAKRFYKIGFAACGLLACILIGIQAWRNNQSQASVTLSIGRMSREMSRLVSDKSPGGITISDKQITDIVMLYTPSSPKHVPVPNVPRQIIIEHSASGGQTVLLNQIKTVLSFVGVDVAEMAVFPGQSDLPVTIKGGGGIDDPEVLRLRLAMGILGIKADYTGGNSTMRLKPNGPEAILLDIR